MARIVKAPNIKMEKPFRVVERDKVMKHAEEEAMEILISAQTEEQKIIEAAQQEAENIITQAAQDAEQLVAEAVNEANQQHSEAYDKGYQEGLSKGQQEAQKRVAGLLNDLRAMITEGQKILEGMFRDQEPEIKKLVCDIVSRVVQAKLDEDDEIVVRIAKKCIGMAADRQSIRIMIHPDNKEIIEEWYPEFTRMYDDIEKVSIEIDPRVSKGGVIIESGTGGIDGRIDKQLDIFNETIENA
jgi:flagellar assembly protein FliH